MQPDDFIRESFKAVIQFGLLAMAGLLFAGVLLDVAGAVECALLAMGSAYVSQLLGTLAAQAINGGAEPPMLVSVFAVVFQLSACVLWLAGALNIIAGV